MQAYWLVRILVDTRGHATDDVAAGIRSRLAPWNGTTVVAEPDLLIRVTVPTEMVESNDAAGIGSYLEHAVRLACSDSGCAQAVVRLTAVEPDLHRPAK